LANFEDEEKKREEKKRKDKKGNEFPRRNEKKMNFHTASSKKK